MKIIIESIFWLNEERRHWWSYCFKIILKKCGASFFLSIVLNRIAILWLWLSRHIVSWTIKFLSIIIFSAKLPTQLGYFFSFARGFCILDLDMIIQNKWLIRCKTAELKKKDERTTNRIRKNVASSSWQASLEFKKINKLPWRQFDSFQDLRTSGLVFQGYFEPPSLMMWKKCNSVIKTHPLMF